MSADVNALRDTYDTFLHFLSDNLVGITVNPVRRDPATPGTDQLMRNALNVQIVTASPNVHIGILQLSLDIINDVELTAFDWVDQVWQLLSAALYTPRFTYTSGTPVATGTNVYWKKSASFRCVYNDSYAHFTAKLTLNCSNF